MLRNGRHDEMSVIDPSWIVSFLVDFGHLLSREIAILASQPSLIFEELTALTCLIISLSSG